MKSAEVIKEPAGTYGKRFKTEKFSGNVGTCGRLWQNLWCNSTWKGLLKQEETERKEEGVFEMEQEENKIKLTK